MGKDLPAALASLIDGVTRVRLIEGGVSRGKALGDRVLCELEDEDAARLLELLAVSQPDEAFHCKCYGNPAIELWVGQDLRATVGLHHGSSIRVDGWWSDAPLREGEALVRFLADHGVEAPLQEARQSAWLEAAPEAIRWVLPELESWFGTPSFLKANERDAEAAVAAVRADLGTGTAAELLRWYGAGAGLWSGFPPYESVAEMLLEIVGAEELIAAGAQSEDETILLGLARFLGRDGAAPRERGLVGEVLRERLGALVARRCDEDARARFAANMQPVARTHDRRRVGDAAFARTLGTPIVCGETLVALDGDRVIRFDPGETCGEVLLVLPPGSVEIAADGDRAVIAALTHRGELWRVPIGGGDVEVIARGLDWPISPVALDGCAAWLEQPRTSGHRNKSRLRLEGRDAPVHEYVGNAWDLLVCRGALVWARHGGVARTPLGEKIHRTDILRWDPGTGRAEVIGALEGGGRLSTDGKVVAWTSGQRLGVLEAATGASRCLEVGAEIMSVRPLGADLLVVIARERDGELIRLDAGGERRTLARWRRAPWERERLAVMGDQVVWNAGEHLWAVPVSPEGET